MSRDFMKIERIGHVYRSAGERVRDFKEVEVPLTEKQLHEQSARCMGCGIPFCHGTGCPLGNLIPDFNEAVHQGDWRQAWELLSATSSFPEFTSRVCPALCEGSCTEGLNLEPVMIRQIEKAIVEHAFANGWIKPSAPEKRSDRKLIIVGAGPAGLAAAVLLNKAGHHVTVYEKNHFPGGLLRYGIPDFKLDKAVVERRIRILEESGIRFVLDTEVGRDVSAEYLRGRCDALLISCGTPVPRDLNIPGRELENIHFALEFLQGQNRANSGESSTVPVSAKGKRVLVIGKRLCRNGEPAGGTKRHADRDHAPSPGNALTLNPLALLALSAAHVFQSRGRLCPAMGTAEQKLFRRKRTGARRGGRPGPLDALAVRTAAEIRGAFRQAGNHRSGSCPAGARFSQARPQSNA